jgi:Zn-finger nucleic acid-binding protein
MSGGTDGLVCPACRVDLVMSERQGIEIDYCPKCRGVWLDRGELDKIVEKSRAYDAQQAAAAPPPRQPAYQQGYQQQGDWPQKRRERRESFLERLFD